MMMSMFSSGVCRCNRCGHEWMPRITGVPRQCPSCKNPKWNVGVKEVSALASKEAVPEKVVQPVPKKNAVGVGCRKCGKKLLEWGPEMMRCIECGLNHPKEG